MKDKLKQIREKALASIESSEGLNGLNDVRDLHGFSLPEVLRQ